MTWQSIRLLGVERKAETFTTLHSGAIDAIIGMYIIIIETFLDFISVICIQYCCLNSSIFVSLRRSKKVDTKTDRAYNEGYVKRNFRNTSRLISRWRTRKRIPIHLCCWRRVWVLSVFIENFHIPFYVRFCS